MNNHEELVHIGLDNNNAIKVGDIDFSSASSIVITLNGKEYSSVDGYISGEQNGVIRFNLAGINLFGVHQVTMLKVIDATHPNGQPLFSQHTNQKLFFKFV